MIVKLQRVANDTPIRGDKLAAVLEGSTRSRFNSIPGVYVLPGDSAATPIMAQAASKGVPVLGVDAKVVLLDQTTFAGDLKIQAKVSYAISKLQVIKSAIDGLRTNGIRVSLFVDPEEGPIRWAAALGADRVELYTEPFARAFEAGESQAQESFRVYVHAAELAHTLGLGVNAGHDLDLDNLVLFRRLPHLDEVSIGHALVSHAIFVGLETSVREYLNVLAA